MPSSPHLTGRPGETTSAASSWQSSNAPLIRQAQRGEGRDEGMTCGFSIVASIVVPRLPAVAIAVPSHTARMIFHPRETAIPRAYIHFAPFSSAHLIRPVSSHHPSHPGKQAGKARRRAVIGAPRPRHRISAPARHRPVSPLVSAGGANSVSLLVASRAAAIRVSPRSPVAVPFRPSPRRACRSPQPVGMASKQAAYFVRPPRPRSAPRVGSVARPWGRRLIDGKGKQNAPLPLSRNGAKSIQTLYRTREL